MYEYFCVQATEMILREMFGPGAKERWLYWKYKTEDQIKRSHVKNELENFLFADYVSST